VIVEQATPEETVALATLARTALKKGWADPTKLFPDQPLGAVTEFKAPTDKVAKLIAKALKPGKKLVSAVKFSNGKMEEVTEALLRSPEAKAPSSSPSEKGIIEKVKDAVATTVAAPVRGCPAPAFSPAQLRAREVLFAFLSLDQRADFERYNRFMAVGATTGHRYMITSRHATDALARYQRTLYDLDEKQPLCVHDFDVPPEEEMHAIHILTQLPGWERFLRSLPE
jgi:hypothetical protein